MARFSLKATKQVTTTSPAAFNVSLTSTRDVAGDKTTLDTNLTAIDAAITAMGALTGYSALTGASAALSAAHAAVVTAQADATNIGLGSGGDLNLSIDTTKWTVSSLRDVFNKLLVQITGNGFLAP